MAQKLRVESIAVGSLSLDPANLRLHPERSIEAIKASLRRFGQRKPIVVDGRGVVRAGNGVLAAAIALGWTRVDAVQLPLRGAEATAFAIADNRVAEHSTWAPELAEMLKALQAEDATMLEATGFTETELNELLDQAGVATSAEDPDDVIPAPPAKPVTRAGDMVLLGRHRLLCGDATDARAVARLFGPDSCDALVTSPPYAQQRDYTQKIEDWDALMQGAFTPIPTAPGCQVLVNLGVYFRDGDWVDYWNRWIPWMGEQGWKRTGWYVWDKGAGKPGASHGRLNPSHEFVFHFSRQARGPAKLIRKQAASVRVARHSTERLKDGSKKVYTSPEAGLQQFRIPESVIRVTPAGSAYGDHPAPFPVGLPELLIRSFSDREARVYDPFAGSGATLIACERAERTGLLMELAPAYCDVIVQRWEETTGAKAKRPARRKGAACA